MDTLLARVTEEPLSVADHEAAVADKAAGAVVSFAGVVRDHDGGRSVTELEADEVGASLKWAAAKVERAAQRGNGDRAQGRERQAERGGDFNDDPPF